MPELHSALRPVKYLSERRLRGGAADPAYELSSASTRDSTGDEHGHILLEAIT